MLFDKLGKKLSSEPKKTLCTITFLYTMKGVMDGKTPKTDTIFAWVEENTTNKDCVPLFNPKGVNKGMCIINEVIVIPIPTVTHLEENSIVPVPAMQVVK